MSGGDKIISLNNLLANQDYQARITQMANDIMGDAEELNTDELLANEKFNSVFTVNEGVNIESIRASVKNIVGTSVTKSELNLVLALMDANAENIKTSKDQEEEKFVFDSQFDIGKKNGLFEALPDEIEKMQNRSFCFQDKGKPIAEIQGRDYVMKYEDGKEFLRMKWGFIPVKLPTYEEFKHFVNNLRNKDD